MGLFSKKKRDPPSPRSPQSTLDSSSSARTTSAQQTSQFLSLPRDSPAEAEVKPRSPTSSAGSRFTNLFRSNSPAEPASNRSATAATPRRSFSGPTDTQYDGHEANRYLVPTAAPSGARGFVRAPIDGRATAQDGPNVLADPRASTSAGYAPVPLETLDRYKLFAGSGAAGGSTASLPLFPREEPEGHRRISTSTTRDRPYEPIHPVVSRNDDDDQSLGVAAGGGKWSRWKMGRGQKQRTGSMSSMRVFGGDSNGSAVGDEGGFVVTSFRTVSRVHEDPVTPSSPTSPPLPPLPSVPSGSALSTYESDPYQQESLRTSVDYGANYPRRPALNTRGPATDSPPALSRDAAKRTPSPSTISVEAFRLASARSKSSVSLSSMAVATDPSSPPLDHDRPKFEPVQRPSSRTSRRQSTYSDLGVGSGAGSSEFLPPRPRFAHHSNSSNSSIQSRKSSQHSIASQTPPVATPPSQPLAETGRAGAGLPPSESFMSVNSFATALESRTASPSTRTTPAQSRIASPVRASTSSTSALALSSPSATGSSALPTRPPNPKRISSGDSDLRWIASYADSIMSNDVTTSPVSYQNPPFPLATPAQRPAVSTPTRKEPATRASRASHTPSFSVQPPTPVTSEISGSPAPSTSSPAASRPTQQKYPKRASSLMSDSTTAALQAAGVGAVPRRKSVDVLTKPVIARPTGKGKAAGLPASRGWMSDSSDEEEQEALETDSGSDSDDEVPLAAIRSRSQTDLSLPPALAQAEVRAKAELEAAAASKQASEAKANGSLLGLGRRGSNRRSISTLSFSTAAMPVPIATAASSSTPNLPPASPTRSILQRPNHPRSVSNPNTPYPSSPTAPAAPAVPAVPSRVTDRSSSSSGTGSTSSALLTPHDLSPAASDLDTKARPGPPPVGGQSVTFDLASMSSASDASRWNKGRRASAIVSSQSSVGSRFTPNGSNFGMHRSTQSLQPFPAASTIGPRSQAAPRSGRPAPGSTLAPSPSGTSLASSKTAVEQNGATGDVFDRMKARHKQEAVEALKLGADLNNPSGLVPQDDEDDEDEPLANLPTRNGSMIGGMDGASMMGGQGAMMGMPYQQHPYGGMGMGMGFGGAYSPLAVAPPGVDPYLYASLPPDQKMSLHQRSQQMMAMMAQAAMQAKAESVTGSAIGGGYGGNDGSMIGGEGGGAHRGPRGGMHGASMSMSNLGSFASYGHFQADQFNANARLPPFAPSFQMSAPFMHAGMHAPSNSLYQMPGFAGSALGFAPSMYAGPGGGSVVGGPAKGQGGRRGSFVPGGRAASMMGGYAQR
ncbi:hypothetical protein JCM10212_000813 [Sporobolomyces blumeae]